jgi:hypothetical protein
MSGVASLYGRSRLANSIPPIANVVISNVPGPQVPLYMAGAKMKTFFPVSIVVHGVALNITVESYNGSLDFGLIACRKAAPDVRDLAGYLAAAHEELKALIAARAAPSATDAANTAPATRRKPAAKAPAAPSEKVAAKSAPVKKSSAKKAVKQATKKAAKKAAKKTASRSAPRKP